MEKVYAAAIDISKIFSPADAFPTVGSLITVVVKNILVLSGIAVLILLIFGGFGVIVSAGEGDTKKLDESKNTLTNAIIGLLIIIASFWIVQILEKITGIGGIVGGGSILNK